MRISQHTGTLIFLGVTLVFFFLISLCVGSSALSFAKSLSVLLGQGTPAETNLILDFRLPRALTAAAGGAALASAGLLMQALFRNPLAGPSVMGVSTGAGLGVALVVLGGVGSVQFLAWGPWLVKVVSGMAGALGVLALILAVSFRMPSVTALLLVGVMCSFFGSALISLLQYASGLDELRTYTLWGMGSFSGTTASQAWGVVCMLLVPGAIALTRAHQLNIYLLGDGYAQSLGLSLRRFQIELIVLAGVLCGVVTAACGPIAFIGLTVPHLARMLLRTFNHSALLKASLLLGASVALVCDLIARLPFFESVLPLNVVTSALGAPVVIYLLMRQKEHIA